MNLEKKYHAIVVGDVFTDLIMADFPKLPQPGEEAFAGRFGREIGGGAAITACGMARLGLSVALLAVVGSDDGSWLIEDLKARGVSVQGIQCNPEESTGLTVSVSTNVDRAFYTYFGANRALPRLLADMDFRHAMSFARHVHLACAPEPDLLVDLAEALHAAGCRISLDTGWHESWLKDAHSLQALRAIDLFFPNEREAEMMTGESEPEGMLRSLADAGLRAVALKRGASGAALLWSEEVFACESYPVETLDTTGAGDGFNAGFIYAYLRGETPARCLQTATICGSLSTRGLGGVATFPTTGELAAALKTINGAVVRRSALRSQEESETA